MKKTQICLFFIFSIVFVSCQNKSELYLVHKISCLTISMPGSCKDGPLDAYRPLFLGKTFDVSYHEDFALLIEQETGHRIVLSTKGLNAAYSNTVTYFDKKFYMKLSHKGPDITLWIDTHTNGKKYSFYCDLSQL